MSHPLSNQSPLDPQASSDDDWLTDAAAWWSDALRADGAGFRSRMDANARNQHPEGPERVDVELFNQHVTPDLDALIAGYACFVRLGMCSYGEAMGRITGYAWRRGAWGFSAAHLNDLRDWIHDQLGAAIEPVGG